MSYYRSRPLDPLTKALGPAEAFVLGLAGGATLALWDWLTWEGALSVGIAGAVLVAFSWLNYERERARADQDVEI
jgi:hypothetical protein